MILVTGSSGLIGSAIMKQKISDLVPIRSTDFDLRDYLQVCKMFEKYPETTGVIHLAANVGGLFKNMKYPVEMYEDNILMNTHILKAAHKYNVNKVLCCLSTCIFPDGISITSTDILHDGPPHSSNESYAYAKRMMDIHCKAYQTEYNREYFCIVPTNVYGPCDNFDDIENAHVIPALIKKFCEASHGSSVLIRGDGSPLRQFVYSEDAARMVLWAYENYKKSIIICPHNSEITIAQAVQIICETSGFKGEIKFEETSSSWKNGQYKKTVEYTQWPDQLPTPTSFNEGIKMTIDWYRSQPSLQPDYQK
jgi:GDP-L-fucose synthase